MKKVKLLEKEFDLTYYDVNLLKENNSYYYLLYKLKQSPIFWIVEESLSKFELLAKINKFTSNEENYYIVEKKYNKSEIKTILNQKKKSFRRFLVNKDCKLVFSTP